MLLLSDSSPMCFDVSMTERSTSEYSWLLGHCSISHKWLGPGSYTEKCCISEGVHILTCSTKRSTNDWSLNGLTILGHRFCDDFVGYETAMAINISGNLC